MPLEYSANLVGFAPVERLAVVAAFDGGAMTSDAGKHGSAPIEPALDETPA